MVNYMLSKGDHDGFNFLMPREIFSSNFESEPICIYDTEYAYYKRNLYNKIEKKYPSAIRISAKNFVNKNRDVVESEVVYVDHNTGILIAIKLHWDINDYAIGELENEYEEEEIKIGINERFQANLKFYSGIDSKEECNWFSKIISKDKKPKRKERELNIICFNTADGFYLKSFKTSKVDIVLEDNYNDDFLEVSDAILNRLKNKDNNGIVLLHSEPGCGKTSYLRYLTQVINNKRLIYLSPELTNRLADPDFMTFLMNYPDSILFIEDAENALQTRGSGNSNPAVSNLLNNSDGLLGDALKLQVVCTFNCPVTAIDPALMRPGRLIAEYRFDKLTEEKTLHLIGKIYGEDTDIYRDYKRTKQRLTLAEAYNLDKKKYRSEAKGSMSIGFNKK